MRLSDIQYEFAKDVSRLFEYLINRNIKFTIGEVWRRPITQQWLYDQGWTGTLKSDHLDKLAIDIFIWIEKRFMSNSWENRDKMMLIGEHWKNLNPKNYWGGDHPIKTKSGDIKPDISHFGRKR